MPTETEVPVTIEPQPPKPAPPPALPGATEPTAPPAASRPPGSGSPGVDDAARSAVGDLAGRLGVDPEAIALATDERVTWRDGSLGCPQPGVAYTQALVPGRRLILSSGGQTYAYHAARSGPFIFCATPDPNGMAPGDSGTDH